MVQNTMFIVTVLANTVLVIGDDDMSKSQQDWIISFNVITLLINLFELGVTLKLFIFHIYIKIKGMSTFEYIKRNQKGYKSRFVIRRSSIDKRRSLPSKSSIIEKSYDMERSHILDKSNILDRQNGNEKSSVDEKSHNALEDT